MAMYVDKSNMNVVSLYFLAKKQGVPPVYKMEDNPVMLARLDTEAVVDNKDGDVPTGKCTLINDQYVVEYRDFTAEELAEKEQLWAKEELELADHEMAKHDDLHSRKVSTPAAWRTYRNALRDHVIGGVVQGDRPVRPS